MLCRFLFLNLAKRPPLPLRHDQLVHRLTVSGVKEKLADGLSRSAGYALSEPPIGNLQPPPAVFARFEVVEKEIYIVCR
jgi:hypothetical protein